MLVVIAVLMALACVLILAMISSVYQLNRDINKKIADMAREMALQRHKLEHLERKIADMEKPT